MSGRLNELVVDTSALMTMLLWCTSAPHHVWSLGWFRKGRAIAWRTPRWNNCF